MVSTPSFDSDNFPLKTGVPMKNVFSFNSTGPYLAAAMSILLPAFAEGATRYTGPVQVTDIRVENGDLFARFSKPLANFSNCTDLTWAVLTGNIPDFNRILSVFLAAKATGADLEVGVMDDDCHTSKIRTASIWIK
jgi:hypothetical protein